MAPLSLKVIQDEGAVTRTVKFESKSKVSTALATVKERIHTADDGKEYALFLTSADDEMSGIWLEDQRNLEYYMLRDGDTLYYLCKTRNLKVRMLDGSMKTLLVDESKPVEELMVNICARIGITNHDEYGLCRDEGDEEEKPALGTSTGTLTLRKVKQPKEKDAKLEHLSKKLKTDDNVQWLAKHKTLREMGIGPKQALLLKRRLFYSDRNVDARDPVQLNLLYLQAKDAILNGKHPVTEDKAVEFAGIQCQICFGDYQEDKHKTGLIENLKEFLPEQYASSWGIEKKIFKEHRKHQEVSSIDAKYLYTKTARDLPTYGVTFFLVKEKHKGKKKLIPRLLGINAEAILRLDEVTKEILQVWPLTHVKSYQVGKSETFSLNFGEYSEKEYCVKTNDAIRIRDILQGYIDIIGKRLAAVYNSSQPEREVIGEDNIKVSRGNIIQHVGYNATKVVEESFVGSSILLPYESGTMISKGTHLVNIKQAMVTGIGSTKQQSISGEVPMRNNASMDFVKKLNRLNSGSVKIVSYLADPNDAHILESQKVVETINAEWPDIQEGVKEMADKQSNEDERKKLLDQLQELCNQVDMLSASMETSKIDAAKGLDAAKNIANISAEMYSSMDPKTKKRSKLLEKSRSSFIADERTAAYLRRTSFLAIASRAGQAVDKAQEILNEKYEGPKIDEQELEKDSADKMGKLNSAIAFVLMAQADPKNVDYSAAVMSMNTIHELIPELARDVQALAVYKEGDEKQKMLDDMKMLCEAAHQVCSLTGAADYEKLQDISNIYSDVSRKLMFKFTRGVIGAQDNKIIELTKDVGDKTSALLVQANKLSEPKSEGGAAVDEAGLTSPTIHEPHCQSALTAASETLSSSAQHLMSTAKPLLEQPAHQHLADDFHRRNTDLTKALDKLQQAYAYEDDAEENKVRREQQRLKFITTLRNANKYLENADKELNKPLIASSKDASSGTEENVAERIAELKSIVASVIATTADRDSPDYASADVAIGTMYTLLPGVIKDAKALSANKEVEARGKIMDDLKKLLAATQEICASTASNNIEELNEVSAKFAEASSDLYYAFSPRVSPVTEDEIIDNSTVACTQASELLANVYQLVEEIGGEEGAVLDKKGTVTADAAKALLAIAQLTAASVNESCCREALVSAVDKLSATAYDLEATFKPMTRDRRYADLGVKLQNQHQQLQDELDKLKKSCPPAVDQCRRMQYVRTAQEMKQAVEAAQQELEKPAGAPVRGEASVVRQLQLQQRMARLNAAIAALVAATAEGKSVDYVKAEEAVCTVNELIPQVVKETKALSASGDEKSRRAAQAELLALCDAVRGISDAAQQHDAKGVNEYASKFSNASGKLTFVVNPRTSAEKTKQIMDISSSVSKQTSQLVAEAQKLSKSVGGQVQLDESSQKTANAAKVLLTCAKLTAPHAGEARCREMLASAAESLRREAGQLAAECALERDSQPALAADVDRSHRQLRGLLDQLAAACGNGGGERIFCISVFLPRKGALRAPLKTVSAIGEKQRLTKAASATQDAVKAAHEELDKPAGAPVRGEASVVRQLQLQQRMARLNAAIAALVAATADGKSVDYVKAEEAICTINELLPQVVKETKALSASGDERSRGVAQAELLALCDAARGICNAAQQHNAKGVNEYASKFSNASGKLTFVVNPRTSAEKTKQIIDISSSVSKQTSQLVAEAQKLSKSVGGQVQLDESSQKTANAAKVLLTCAKLTAPHASEARCREVLASSAESLRREAGQLAAECAPERDSQPALAADVDRSHRQLRGLLDQLAAACGDAGGKGTLGAPQKTVSAVGEKQRLTRAASATQDAVKAAHQELDKPLRAPLTNEEAASRREQLSRYMADLNAASAALLAAILDGDEPDYITAEKAVRTVNEILPHVAKDARVACPLIDAKPQKDMEEEMRALCDAALSLSHAAVQRDPQTLNEHASKLAKASNGLMYIVNPQTQPDISKKIIVLSQSAHDKVAKIVTDAQQLAKTVGGEKGTKLSNSAGKTADAARVLLTSQQLVIPYISEARSQATLISAADSLSAAARDLTNQCGILKQNPQHAAFVSKLDSQNQNLQTDLDELRDICQNISKGKATAVTEDANTEAQRLQFVRTVSASKNAVDAAHQELGTPIVGLPLKAEAAVAQQLKLSQWMAQLNAAIAALATAVSGRDPIDYVTAEKAVTIVNELLPRVAKETKVLGTRLDDGSQAVLVGDLRSLCESVQELCSASGEQNITAVNNSAAKCANMAAKLCSAVNPHINPEKEQQIINLSTKACSGASQILATVYKLSEAEGGEVGAQLDQTGSRTVNAAKTLLTAAQLTAPYIHEQPCQMALISAIDELSTSSKQLSSMWQLVVKNPRHEAVKSSLEQQYPQLESDLALLKKMCKDVNRISNPIKSTTMNQPPLPPKRSKSKTEVLPSPTAPDDKRRSSRDVNEESLDKIRREQSKNEAPFVTEAEKAVQKQFVSCTEDAVRNLRVAEEEMKNLKSDGPVLSEDQKIAVQNAIEQKLGLSAAAVATLLASNQTDTVDYNTASKSMKTLSDLMPAVVKDAKTLHSTVAEKDRQSFIDNILELLHSGNKLCNTATGDRQKLSQVAVDYGNKSATLLYSVGGEADPEQEKEVGGRTQAVGDSMSRLVRVGAGAATVPSVCSAAASCARAAAGLAYTAKLVAPTIQIPECLRCLISASDELASDLKTFADTWKPLAADPEYKEAVQEMSSELKDLEGLLLNLKQDLVSGKMVRRKKRIVVENTPLRQLAISLLENAKKRSQSVTLDAKQKQEYEKYAIALKNAVQQLDIANWACKRSLHDTDKRLQLENAVQNLQMIVLQERPSLAGNSQNNIVDLSNYVKDLSSDAEELISASNKCSSDVQVIQEICNQIKNEANNVLYPSNVHNRGMGSTVDDIHEIDKFGRDCSNRIKELQSQISKVADVNERAKLENKLLSLEDTLNLLRFVTQSAVATTTSATLDETLNDLTDLENRIQQMLLPVEKLPGLNVERTGPGAASEWGKSQVVAAASGGNLQKLASAFLAYADDMRTHAQLSDPSENKRVKEHLQKMMYLLKILTVTTSRRVVTWQEVSGPEIATVTEQLLKEIDKVSQNSPGKSQKSVLSNIDANKLLLFTESKIKGEKTHIEGKLQLTSTKLSSMLGTVVLSTSNPQSLTRSLKATVETATELAVLARALKTNDPLQNAKIEEVVREMNFYTYNIVKISDLVSQEANNRVYRKRLLDSCRMLNDAINKIVRVTMVSSSASPRRREIDEMTRSLQLQQTLLQAPPQPTCSMSYTDCIDALNSQNEVIDKLKSEEQMSQEQLSKAMVYVSAAVQNSTEYAMQCAYFVSLPDGDMEVAKTGLVDVHQLVINVEILHEICYRILQFEPDQVKSEEPDLTKQVENLKQALTEGSKKSVHLKEELLQAVNKVDKAAEDLRKVINEPNTNRNKITSATIKLLDTLKLVNSISEHPSLLPKVSEVTTEAQQRRDDILKSSRSLTTKTLALMKEVRSAEDQEIMTWVMFRTRKDLLDTFEALVDVVKENGKRSGILEMAVETEEEPKKKSFVQIQLELASKWLITSRSTSDTKEAGEKAAQKILEIAEQMAEELKGPENEEIRHLIVESKQLLSSCSIKYSKENSSQLVERLKGLKKCIERGMVTIVVEDFMQENEPLADLDYLIDAEPDASKRKFILERKIAELQAQLQRMKKTARLVVKAGSGAEQVCVELEKCANQVDLLAPLLVKAAEDGVNSSNDEAAVEKYKAILTEYTESLLRVRDLCDQSVDPMDFVQTAGETMQRLREDSSSSNDYYQCAMSITKLAKRVINVSMTSSNAKRDPELKRALNEVQRRMSVNLVAADTRCSRLPDWRVTTAEILRSTGEVESVLGGEMIFQKQPESNQPIFTAALGLHAAVRGWSARDNEIVAVAKRMAVLMARLSDYMNNNRKRELIATSKKIVNESNEVASLARNLASECSDIRIKTNLQQVCQRIPTISGQLKMLTTIRGAMLGPEGSREDQQDVTMLVDNAQNLMLSIEEVVKVAAGASVKIMSQRGGPRVRWVRRNY
ncbi:talin-1-like [Achroia grisella]|uniref:talin-1-like n=1 Tax=Achroia grisella TaxID=688607 RepID=UPI0027D2BE23|nr:talin-1-like [Achroia grisella]